jgi:hypothetical protein
MTACPHCHTDYLARLGDVRNAEECATCPQCQEWLRKFEAYPPALPTLSLVFADRVLARLQAEPVVTPSRRPWGTIVATGISIAACVVIYVMNSPAPAPLVAPTSPRNEVAAQSIAPEPLAPRFDEVSQAVVALTKRTTAQTLEPTRHLFAIPSRMPTTATPPAATPRAISPTDPLTHTATRAMRSFMRDLGAAASVGKSRS